MKKITGISIVIAVCLLLSLPVLVQAAEPAFDLTSWQPDHANLVTVSGRGSANISEDEAALVIYHQETGEVVFADQQTICADTMFQFNTLPITGEFQTGFYTVRVAAAKLGTVEKSFYIADAGRLSDILRQVSQTDEDALDALLETKAEDGITYGEILDIDMESYRALNSRKLLFALLVDGRASYALGEAPTQAEIDAALSSFRRLYQDAFAIQSWQNAGGDGAARANWVVSQQTGAYGSAAYDPRYDLDGEADAPSAAEDLRLSLQRRAAAEKVLSDICSADASDGGSRERVFQEILADQPALSSSGYAAWSPESWENRTLADYYLSVIRNQILESKILAAVSELPLGYGLELMDNTLLFEDLDNYRGLSPVRKANALESVWGKRYDSLKDFVAALERAAQNQMTTSGGGTGPGGGGGGDLSGSYAPGNGTVVINDNGQPQQTGRHFTDLEDVSWAVPAIEALYAKGVINGYGNGEFRPNNTITRAEFVKMLVAAFGMTSDGAACDFRDVPSDAWYYPFVASAVQVGLVNGVGDGNFEPERTITREEIAAVLYRTAVASGREIIKRTSLDFSDGNEVEEYAREAVASLTGAGIINGMGDGTFAPKDPGTRAQAAKLIYELLQI